MCPKTTDRVVQSCQQGRLVDFCRCESYSPDDGLVNPLVVFDIGGNKYRLIASVHFNRGKLIVRNVLTQAEYNLGDWKCE